MNAQMVGFNNTGEGASTLYAQQRSHNINGEIPRLFSPRSNSRSIRNFPFPLNVRLFSSLPFLSLADTGFSLVAHPSSRIISPMHHPQYPSIQSIKKPSSPVHSTMNGFEYTLQRRVKSWRWEKVIMDRYIKLVLVRMGKCTRVVQRMVCFLFLSVLEG